MLQKLLTLTPTTLPTPLRLPILPRPLMPFARLKRQTLPVLLMPLL